MTKKDNSTELLEHLNNLQKELDTIHNNLDFITDEALIDCCIYEMKAVQIKYHYYLRLCKEQGLVAFYA